MVKCLPEFEYFTVFMKNRNFISKIRRSKVTDSAALNVHIKLSSGIRCSILLFVLCCGKTKLCRANAYALARQSLCWSLMR